MQTNRHKILYGSNSQGAIVLPRESNVSFWHVIGLYSGIHSVTKK